MDSYTFYVFVSGFSVLMMIHTFVRSYLNSWDRSYLYCSILFLCAFLNCVFWSLDVDFTKFGFRLYYNGGGNPGMWFNHLTPLMLLLLYREFLKVKEDNLVIYKMMTAGIWIIGLTILAVILFTFIPDTYEVTRKGEQIFQLILLILFSILPIYTLKRFRHSYYKFVALSSWLIWIFYGIFYLGIQSETLLSLSPMFIKSGRILFVILLVDGILFLTALSVKDNIIASERIQFEKEANNQKIMALQTQLNPHFVFNCLNSIKSLNLSGHIDQANYYLTKFGKLMRQILIQSKQKSITLKEELENVKVYLELEKLRMGKKIQYSLSVDDDIDAELIKVPPMIIQPYAENALWHGLSPVASSLELRIHLNLTGDNLIMHIEDDGIGYLASISSKPESPNRKSFGTNISNERIASLGHITTSSASVKIQDKSTMSPVGTGTRVTIQIPLDYDHIDH